MSHVLVRNELLRLEVFSRRCGLHPELIRRLVTLGLLDPARDVPGEMWFSPAQVSRVARMNRLRTELALNYSALGLVLDLLDRIERLEGASRRAGTQPMASSTGSEYLMLNERET